MLPRNSTTKCVDKVLILKNEKPFLKDSLLQLLKESGWVDVVRLICREEITKANGLVSVDNLVERVTPKARQKIPDEIKAEMILKIKQTLLKAESSDQD